MNRIAFLSTDHLDGFTADDHLANEPLQELGWSVETISWRMPDIDWGQFAGIVIRTTWDYHNHLPEFLGVLEQIESATRLANPLSIVRWNANKTYLRDLEAHGARVVRTLWEEGRIEGRQIHRWFEELQTDDLVIKPTVSASAADTLRLQKRFEIDPEPLSIFANRQYMVQPFMNGIVEEGEFSLFYFCGDYSHTILKTPKAQDFRVQEEHGGYIQAVEPTARLLQAGASVMQPIKPMPLYARIDFVHEQDELVLMELELIEPSLYLRMDDGAPRRFAIAIDAWLG